MTNTTSPKLTLPVTADALEAEIDRCSARMRAVWSSDLHSEFSRRLHRADRRLKCLLFVGPAEFSYARGEFDARVDQFYARLARVDRRMPRVEAADMVRDEMRAYEATLA